MVAPLVGLAARLAAKKLSKKTVSKALKNAREEFKGLFNQNAPKNMSAKDIKEYIRHQDDILAKKYPDLK
jgi:fructose-specific phosphotransferase system component IIB